MNAILALVVLSAAPSSCRRAYQELHYRDAELLCRQAVRGAPDLQLPEVYRLWGLSLAALGRAGEAQEVFDSLLALDPTVELGESSPKLRAPFERARASAPPQAAQIFLDGKVAPDAPLRFELRVQDGPARPIRRLVVRRDGTEQSLPRGTGEDPLKVTLPVGPGEAPVVIRVTGLDRFEGVLASAERSWTPRAPPSGGGRRVSPAAWGWAAAGVTGVAGGLGVVSLVWTQKARRDFYADASSRDARVARGAAVAAETALGLATALMAGALLSHLFGEGTAR